MSALSITTPTITIQGDTLSTTSTDVATFFGRKHKNVVQTIDNLKCSPEFLSANFSADDKMVMIGKGGTIAVTEYTMTEQGFTMLAMGFTGERAMKFKEAYITHFHAMQTELLKKYKQAALPSTITPKQKLSIRNAMAKKVYDNYGKKQIPTGFKTEWHDFYEAFEISKYEELPATRFDDAMGYILGEWIPEDSNIIKVDKNNLNALVTLVNNNAKVYNNSIKSMKNKVHLLSEMVDDLRNEQMDFVENTFDSVRDASMIASSFKSGLKKLN